MALPDFDSYKYIMFVDASGDDGYKFKKSSSEGSSYSFVVSCFVTTPQELSYNKQILLNMKKAIFVRPEQEIKSTALKRHKNADLVYKEMSHLHGFAYSLVADKRLLQNASADYDSIWDEISFVAQSELSGVTHLFPYIVLRNSERLSENDKVLIVIDNMKKREMNSIREILSDDPPEHYDLVFRDSKDKNFSLIQIADIFAGTIRTYYENCLPLKLHNQYCKACSTLILNNRKGIMLGKCFDKKSKKLYLPYVTDFKFNTVMYLHKDELSESFSETGCGDHFIIFPLSQLLYFTYIDCHIFQARPWE